MPASPTLRRRRLAAELRRLREAADLTIEQAARVATISASHLSRVENAAVGVRVLTVKELLRAYNVDPETTSYLIQVAGEANQRGWWQEYGGVISPGYATYIGFEAEASSIWNFEASAVPGLLQTEDYARALAESGTSKPVDDVIRRVEVRTARQAILTRPDPPELWFVLDEAAIRRQVGSKQIMTDQLKHIIELAKLPNLDVQVIPFAAGSHPGIYGGLVILSFPEDPPVVYVETLFGELFPEKKQDIDRATSAFNRLRAMALSPEGSVRLIRDAAKEQ